MAEDTDHDAAQHDASAKNPKDKGEHTNMTIRTTFKHSFWICWKDLAEFSRSKLRVIMLILMPLFMMCMVGFIFPSGTTIKDTPVAIALQD